MSPAAHPSTTMHVKLMMHTSHACIIIYCVHQTPRHYCCCMLQTHQHNIANCPYAHPGERSVRRDVRVFQFDSSLCLDLLQTGHCPRQEQCNAAHSVSVMRQEHAWQLIIREPTV
jgi:hypothetical protein